MYMIHFIIFTCFTYVELKLSNIVHSVKKTAGGNFRR